MMKKTEFTINTTIDGKNATAINIERERERAVVAHGQLSTI